MNYTQHYESPLGGITFASDGEALTGLWFDGQRYFGDGLKKTRQEKNLPIFWQAARWLDIYFGGGIPDFFPPLRTRGTPFQAAVWDILLSIPYGQTVTYGQIAAMLPRASARAVGGAVGRNPIAIIIPCHRVLGADGSLTGYAGGADRKKQLLLLEHAIINP